MEDSTTEFKYYHYNPSMVAAVIFIILFFLATSLHSYQLVRTRTWFVIPLVIGGFCKFIYCLKNSRHQLRTIFCSRRIRLRWTSSLAYTNTELDSGTLLSPNPPHSCCSCPVRSDNLHGTWPHYLARRWGRACYNKKEMAH